MKYSLYTDYTGGKKSKSLKIRILGAFKKKKGSLNNVIVGYIRCIKYNKKKKLGYIKLRYVKLRYLKLRYLNKRIFRLFINYKNNYHDDYHDDYHDYFDDFDYGSVEPIPMENKKEDNSNYGPIKPIPMENKKEDNSNYGPIKPIKPISNIKYVENNENKTPMDEYSISKYLIKKIVESNNPIFRYILGSILNIIFYSELRMYSFYNKNRIRLINFISVFNLIKRIIKKMKRDFFL